MYVYYCFCCGSADCPVGDMDDFRVEVLIHLRKLERLDKEAFSSDERADAEEVRKPRTTLATEP